MALINWGYKRRYWTRVTKPYGAGESRVWDSNSYVSTTGAEKPTTARIGSHSVSESTQNIAISGVPKKVTTQHIYNDCVYMVFPIPAAAVRSATISFYIPTQSYTSKIKARRITSAFSGNGFPNVTSTNAVEVNTVADGALLTFDVTGIINDAVAGGAFYGIAFTANDTDPWYTRKNTITFDDVQLGGSIGDGLRNISVIIDGVKHSAVGGKIIVDGTAKKVIGTKVYAGGKWNG